MRVAAYNPYNPYNQSEPKVFYLTRWRLASPQHQFLYQVDTNLQLSQGGKAWRPQVYGMDSDDLWIHKKKKKLFNRKLT
jgi:hypothetical protein